MTAPLPASRRLAGAVPGVAPRGGSPWWRRPWIWFVLPALLGYGVLFVYPTLRAFWLSLFDWSGVGAVGAFVGLENFGQVVRSDRFWRAALHSGQLFAFIFVFQNTVSLGLALMLNRRSAMTHVYRAIVFLPVVMSAVATGIIWILMLDPVIGVVNPVLRDIGLAGWQREWQADPDWAMKTVMLVQAWQWNGMAVVLYLAGLQGVPEDLRHAALVDGARRWQVFRDVTFPMLAPAFTVVTVLSFILIFRAFDLIYVMTKGGPANSTSLGIFYIYQQAFQFNDYGYAAAMSSFLVLLLLAATALMFVLTGGGRFETE